MLLLNCRCSWICYFYNVEWLFFCWGMGAELLHIKMEHASAGIWTILAFIHVYFFHRLCLYFILSWAFWAVIIYHWIVFDWFYILSSSFFLSFSSFSAPCVCILLACCSCYICMPDCLYHDTRSCHIFYLNLVNILIDKNQIGGTSWIWCIRNKYIRI